MPDDRPAPEWPRAEPEILPPDRGGWEQPRQQRRFPDAGGMPRIYVTRLGPLGGGLLVLALILFAVIVLLAVAGALLLWLPILGLIVVAAGLTALFRNRRR